MYKNGLGTKWLTMADVSWNQTKKKLYIVAYILLVLDRNTCYYNYM